MAELKVKIRRLSKVFECRADFSLCRSGMRAVVLVAIFDGRCHKTYKITTQKSKTQQTMDGKRRRMDVRRRDPVGCVIGLHGIQISVLPLRSTHTRQHRLMCHGFIVSESYKPKHIWLRNRHAADSYISNIET